MKSHTTRSSDWLANFSNNEQGRAAQNMETSRFTASPGDKTKSSPDSNRLDFQDAALDLDDPGDLEEDCAVLQEDISLSKAGHYHSRHLVHAYPGEYDKSNIANQDVFDSGCFSGGSQSCFSEDFSRLSLQSDLSPAKPKYSDSDTVPADTDDSLYATKEPTCDSNVAFDEVNWVFSQDEDGDK